MRSLLKKELERRPAHALLAPPDYENRVMDLAIEALEDIRECDEAVIYVKWDRMPTGTVAPLLYILFDGTCPSLAAVPRVHMHPTTNRPHPAHAICLRKMPAGALLEGQEVKDVVRRGVEDFLRRHGVEPSSMTAPPPQRMDSTPGPS
jgi:hypothetical protein